MVGSFLKAERFDVVHSWAPEELRFVQDRHAGLISSFGPGADSATICHTQSELMQIVRASRVDGKRLAILAASDFYANGLIDMCLAQQLRVPEDVAVIGVDNDWIAQAFCPIPLTSVILPALEMGRLALRTVLEVMSGDSLPPRIQRLQPVQILEQQSTESWLIDNDLVRQALRLLKTARPPISSVDELADRLSVSRRTLDRQIQAELRVTAYHLLRRSRVDHCKTLLASTEEPLEEVARQGGFSSMETMANAFRQENESAPSRFRKRARAAFYGKS
jgi:LacI family transcriptional regulator